MSYLVLARKWRPMRFEDLIGQDHVARTLGNAIKNGRVAHAFLFTGVRGVGKTTSARILAKALNCMGDPDTTPAGKDPGPTTSPCLKCPACLEIAQGTDIDVREIDGASYNGVDEVRKLQDSIPYRPNRDRFKIYIVDEVHMLSSSAWNAFLKTLEEPPAHVKFIFATTEVHKVPITILSRVQRFDFKMISTQSIALRLAHVLEKEGIQTDEAAISIVAREAAGSMRDAMSLLDQVIAWGGESLKGEDVARVLGVASHAVLYELGRALLAGDTRRCLEIVAELSDQGYDIAHVAKDAMALLRNLVVAKVCKAPGPLLDLPDEEARDVERLVESAEADDLVRLHQAFAAGFDEVVKSGQPRAALEMLLVRLSRRPPLVPLDTLVNRLVQLERRLGGGGNPRPPSGGRPPGQPLAGPPGAPARPRDPRPARESSPESGGDDRGEPPPAFEAPPPRTEPSPRLEFSHSLSRAESAPASHAEAVSTGRPSSWPAPNPRTDPPPSRGDSPPSSPPSHPPPHSVRPRPLVPRAPGQSLDLEDLLRGLVGRVASERPELAAKLEHAVPLEFSEGKLVLGWGPGNVFGDLVARPETTAELERVATAMLGKPTRISHELESARVAGKKTLSRLEAEERERKVREAYDRARRHPRIAEAAEILGAKLRDLKLAKAP